MVATYLALRRLVLRTADLREAERAAPSLPGPPPSIEPRIVVRAHSPGLGVAVVCAGWAAYLPQAAAQTALAELTEVAGLDPLTAVRHLERLPSPHFDWVVRRLAATGGSVVEHDTGELRTESGTCIVNSVGDTVEVEQMRFDKNLADEWRKRVLSSWADAPVLSPRSA